MVQSPVAVFFLGEVVPEIADLLRSHCAAERWDGNKLLASICSAEPKALRAWLEAA